jgi:2-polyprenyl-3-methyl-5-hydroxy-6-metoxy-1,4-benzoquinol methylase
MAQFKDPKFAELSEIVPEYESRNPLVRWIFLERLNICARLGALDAPQPLRIAEVGCGEGRMLRVLRAADPRHRIQGLDYNPNVLKIDIPGVEMGTADITDPKSLAPDSYDRIFCLDMLEHLKDVSGPIATLRAALRPGGMLIISAPAENAFHKFCRLLLKGKLSKDEGSDHSPHYHRGDTLERDILAAGFVPAGKSSLPLPGPLSLLKLYAFRRG